MRTAIKLVIALGTVVVLTVGGFAAYIAWSFAQSSIDTVGKVDFDRPLVIPPLAESTVDPSGVRTFDLTMQAGESDLGRGAPTPTWGFNGSFLGPTLRATRGEQVRVNVTSRLGETSTVHWHGMHLPASMDGGPRQPIQPGGRWSPHWTIDQPAATLWYHPHPHGETAKHVYRGLAGMFLLDDANDVALPKTYGVDDFPIMVQDKAFDGNQLDESHGLFQSTGILGDTVLVNGTPGAFLQATTERVRLRVLNGSNARVYRFHFDDNRRYAVVASDGGLLPRPVLTDELLLSPGERAEIVVDVRPGDRTVLQSAPPTGDGNRFTGGSDRLDILELRGATTLAPSPPLPSELAPAPDLADDVIGATRSISLSGTRTNFGKMDMGRVDIVSTLDTTESWTVTNADGQVHNFHIHDVQFQVIRYAGGPPPAVLAGWKDTVLIPNGASVELRMRFTDFADTQSPYMFHCHLLRHEDEGLMGQFVVARPGETADRIEVSDHADHGAGAAAEKRTTRHTH
ncbi:multicopper oxidase family protein [Knoellia subterranea]|uniref:Copper oxidase n=1 Tax=Knoellia subterranea KCTC 19937 TaxID=1385521 RepID=A0A0A0JQQ8_9MICO|nr:multicopper oxidase domain-containing protein [Knoellia subterranea]KGN37921.1 copper oxidase [Knoellia subterranea KCTC 19937]